VLNFGDSVPVEQYRRLAARLLIAQTEKNIGVVMVTSAFPAEGKTLTATNLALTLSESYKRKVLLVDADLRRPWVHQVFQVPNVSGLNDGLRDDSDRKIPLLAYTENLSILTAGRPDADPMSVLSGERVSRVLQEARSRFEWVIIDTPPVALLTDAHLLSSLVDAVVLIVQAGKTPLPAIKMAVESVGRERILGVVLNRAVTSAPDGAYSYYDSSYRTAERA
jgi:capsular exopolysaccharide synthesis family protein